MMILSQRRGAHLITASVIFLFLSAVWLSGCGVQSVDEPPDEVTVQLSWVHQGQFAGLYAAEEQGFFADEGLQVILAPRSTPNTDVIAQVLEGKADFGLTSGLRMLTARSQAQPVAAVAVIYRRSPKVFMTLAGSGISSPYDFPGHTVRAMASGINDIDFQAMMAHLGIDPDSIRQVESGFDLAPFFEGEVDIWPGFITDEVLVSRELGYEVNVIFPHDYRIHTYHEVLFTSDQLVRENPELVLRFLRAVLKGWRWAVENLQEAAELALKFDGTLDAKHELAALRASVPLIHTGRPDRLDAPRNLAGDI